MKTGFIVILPLIAFLSSRAQAIKEHQTDGQIDESLSHSASPDVIAPRSQSPESFFDTWASNIRKGHFEDIKSLVSSSPTESLNEKLPKLIRITYGGNLDYFDNILRFVSELPHTSSIVIGYQALFDAMNKNGHLYHNTRILKLAYKVKAAMRDENGRGELENLKKQFPAYIQQLMWNGNCFIKNNHWNEHLYCGTADSNYDSSKGRVFTWILSDVPKVIKSWKFEPQEEAEYFTIKSHDCSKYLIAGNRSSAYDSQNRRVFTWLPGNPVSEGNWILEPAGDNYYKLKNKLYNEYLYAAGDRYNYDHDNRRVFTWIGGDIVDGGYWSLICN